MKLHATDPTLRYDIEVTLNGSLSETEKSQLLGKLQDAVESTLGKAAASTIELHTLRG